MQNVILLYHCLGFNRFPKISLYSKGMSYIYLQRSEKKMKLANEFYKNHIVTYLYCLKRWHASRGSRPLAQKPTGMGKRLAACPFCADDYIALA